MLNIIVSPIAKNKLVSNATKKVVRFLKSKNTEYAVYFSEQIEEVELTVKELYTRGETNFVVIGEDNTISAILNGSNDVTKINIGIVPAGKNIDFAKHLEISDKPTEAIQDILDNNVVDVDYLIVNGKKVINNIIIGASADLEEAYRQLKHDNFLMRKFTSFKNIPNYEGIKLDIETNKDQPFSANIYELSIANGGLNKGKKTSPLANVKDGLFNFNYVEILPKEERKKYFSLFKKGNQIYNENTKQSWITSLKITNEDNKIRALVDGELKECESFDVKIVKAGLKLYMKKI